MATRLADLAGDAGTDPGRREGQCTAPGYAEETELEGKFWPGRVPVNFLFCFNLLISYNVATVVKI